MKKSKLKEKIKSLTKYTDCSMPQNEKERTQKAEVAAYNQALNDVIELPILTSQTHERDAIEKLLSLEDSEIKQLYNKWDKGDCSLVGLAEIYLYQCIKKHKLENGVNYDTDYDAIRLRCGQP